MIKLLVLNEFIKSFYGLSREEAIEIRSKYDLKRMGDDIEKLNTDFLNKYVIDKSVTAD